MAYEEIITNVAKTFDPQQTINVTIVTSTDLDKAHFVVADIEYVGDSELRIPFVIYNENEIFMPQDWQCGALPETADGIDDINWVTYPNGQDAIIMDGLPRILTGNF